MKGRSLLVLLGLILCGGCKTATFRREAAEAEELPLGRIEKALSLLEEGAIRPARDLLRSVHDDYTSKDWYSIGFFEKQRLYLYLALCETLLGNTEAGGEAMELALSVKNIMWGTSWDSTAEEFVRSTAELSGGWTEGQRGDWCAMLFEIHRSMGDRDRALRFARMAYEADRDSAGKAHALGLALLESGRCRESVPYFRKAVQENPDSAELLSDLGSACNIAGKSKEAAGYLEKSLALDGDRLKTRVNLALVYSAIGRCDAAERLIRESAPRFPEGEKLLGAVSLYCLLGTGQYAEAERTLDSLGEEFVEEHPVVMALRAALLESTGREEEAGKTLRAVLQKVPEAKERGFLRNNWSFRGPVLESLTAVIDSIGNADVSP